MVYNSKTHALKVGISHLILAKYNSSVIWIWFIWFNVSHFEKRI